MDGAVAAACVIVCTPFITSAHFGVISETVKRLYDVSAEWRVFAARCDCQLCMQGRVSDVTNAKDWLTALLASNRGADIAFAPTAAIKAVAGGRTEAGDGFCVPFTALYCICRFGGGLEPNEAVSLASLVASVALWGVCPAVESWHATAEGVPDAGMSLLPGGSRSVSGSRHPAADVPRMYSKLGPAAWLLADPPPLRGFYAAIKQLQARFAITVWSATACGELESEIRRVCTAAGLRLSFCSAINTMHFCGGLGDAVVIGCLIASLSGMTDVSVGALRQYVDHQLSFGGLVGYCKRSRCKRGTSRTCLASCAGGRQP
jgi:hypothetical protein